jgi:hypothetical protein
MLSRTAAVLALAGPAAAFSPMMSMDMGRREIVKAGAAAAAVAPLLRPTEADAMLTAQKGKFCAEGRSNGSCNSAPIITIFDHRGCSRGGPNSEYRGKQSGDQDDEVRPVRKLCYSCISKL